VVQKSVLFGILTITFRIWRFRTCSKPTNGRSWSYCMA